MDVNLTERPAWQLPLGVSRGTWDYVNSQAIAKDYDHFFVGDRLMALDQQLVLSHLPAQAGDADEPLVVADFGCGTGRIASLLLPLGYKLLNLDLSQEMLRQVAEKSMGNDFSACVHANLAQLDCLRDGTLDLGVCLYSSLGMLRGRAHRLGFLQAVRRCLKSDGRLLLHVHNRFHRSYSSSRLLWLLQSYLQSRHDDYEFGDRIFAYRGLPKMFLHIFSRTEILRDMRDAGFSDTEVIPIDGTSARLLPKRTRLIDLRAGGFFVIGRR